MFAQVLRSAAVRRCAPLWRHRLSAALAAAMLLTQGCAPTTPQTTGADASDPQALAPAATYRPVLGNYTSQRPVEPLPWTERNQSVTPPAKRDGQ